MILIESQKKRYPQYKFAATCPILIESSGAVAISLQPRSISFDQDHREGKYLRSGVALVVLSDPNAQRGVHSLKR